MPSPESAPCPACGKEIIPPPRRRRKCPHCREWVPAVETESAGDPAPANASGTAADEGQDPARFADYKMFRSGLSPWESLFQQAADFATQLGPDRVISIAHSENNGEAVVTVWYWREALEVTDSGP
jgi:hypothetical protein